MSLFDEVNLYINFYDWINLNIDLCGRTALSQSAFGTWMEFSLKWDPPQPPPPAAELIAK